MQEGKITRSIFPYLFMYANLESYSFLAYALASDKTNKIGIIYNIVHKMQEGKITRSIFPYLFMYANLESYSFLAYALASAAPTSAL